MSTDGVEDFPQVCIIESPSDRDVLDGRNEGEALSRALSLADVKNNHYFVTTGPMLDEALQRMLTDAAITPGSVARFPMLYIHLSAHGNTDGIRLTSGKFLSWSELGDKLICFADRAGRIFPEVPACMQFLCFSVCHGLHGATMTAGKSICPFYGLVGPQHAVGWADSLTAFTTLYHNICHKGVGMKDGVERMNMAIGERELFYPVVAEQLGYKGEDFE